MAEFTNVFVQQVAANGNAVFSETPVSGSNCIVHRDGSGIITLRGMTNQCRARYKVVFGGNVAIPTGGAVGPISIAISVEGEALGSATAIVTPASSSWSMIACKSSIVTLHISLSARVSRRAHDAL